MVEIRRTPIRDMLAQPQLVGLLQSYADECAIPALGPIAPNFEQYVAMADAGAAVLLGAFSGDELVGFAVVIVYSNPHYGRTLAVVESIFLGKAHRADNTGRNLVAAVEAEARSDGAEAVLFSAPKGGALDKVIERWGYTHTNRVFTKAL